MNGQLFSPISNQDTRQPPTPPCYNPGMSDERKRRQRVLATISFILMFATSCDSQDGGVIELILPNGFRGVFVIELDPVHGVPPTSTGNVATYRIPESGILHVSSFSPFEEWHKKQARQQDGKEIPTINDESRGVSTKDLDTEVRLRGGMNDGQRIYFLVGTEAELQELRSTWKLWHTVHRE